MSEHASQGESIHENETTENSSMDVSTSTNDNSIIGKVKSGVTSILPNRISKWFSNSTKTRNDSSLNGSLIINAAVKRRRRRSEVDEEDDNEDVNEDLQSKYEEFAEHNRFHRQEENSEEDDEEEDEEDDESHNSEEEEVHSGVPVRRDLNSFSTTTVQPPAKRSRLHINSTRSSPLIAHHQSIVASTPAVSSSNCRSSNIGAASRSPYQRYGHLNLYGHQSRKEPPYDFMASKPNLKTDIIDLVSNPIDLEKDASSIKSDAMNSSRISSRRSLNLPLASSNAASEHYFATTSHLKRQPLSSVKQDFSADTEIGKIRHSSTAIHETLKKTITQEPVQDINQSRKYNGRSGEEEDDGEIRQVNMKRRKLINGSRGGTTQSMAANENLLQDTGSESGESGIIDANSHVMADNDGRESDQTCQQRKAGLYNTTPVSGSRQVSRASSFGNGLNFYSHLEGRKSLFAEPGAQISVSGNMLNTSTLSLNSLNRRQFNASIYGSTSALSDSRLLNTFSPFYKGKTTYGGAAAYHKNYTSAGAGAVRIAPTLIRPNSSLSNLSSSNNSLSATGHLGDNSTISSTAKRLLDLINDFSTPLGEAKKMANSFRANMPQLAGRLNENELNASRAIRLSHVRSPYMKPSTAVLLQPSGSVKARSSGPLPPIKELQVPSMSQLLQMKRMQNTTEKVSQITKHNMSTTTTSPSTSEYTSPAHEELNRKNNKIFEQQKHTNKIKNKIMNTARSTGASHDLIAEAPPPPVNLPNIVFPMMKSVPQFDIQLALPAASVVSAISNSTTKQQAATTNSGFTQNEQSVSTVMIPTVSEPILRTPTSKRTTNFIFSSPTTVEAMSTTYAQNIKLKDTKHYKFSSPIYLLQSSKSTNYSGSLDHTIGTQLKSGSVLEALSKEPLASIKTKEQASKTTSGNTLNSFGAQFKKTDSEWECSVCKARNKSETVKCVACKSTKKVEGQETLPDNNTNLSLTSSTFGSQFRKNAGEWECEECMVRNKHEFNKCVACQTSKKGSSPKSTLGVDKGFGDIFKSKSNTWECSICLVVNKIEANNCVACQNKKPGKIDSAVSSSGSVASTNTFKFGFAAAKSIDINHTTAITSNTTGFKLLAAQQTASKWECEACMTRNDVGRIKCVCCEQPKPGSIFTDTSSNNVQKFTFGANASKFSFGFSSAANNSKDGSDSKQVATELRTNDAIATKPALTTTEFETETSASTAEGFKFGATSSDNSNKDACDGTNKIQQGNVPTSTTAGFTFKKKEETKSCTSDTPTTISVSFSSITEQVASSPIILPATTASSTPSVKFNLGNSTKTVSSTENSFSSNVDKAPQNTFSGSLTMTAPLSTSASAVDKNQPKSDEKNLSSTTSLTHKNPLEGYTFGNFAATTFATALPSSTTNATTATTVAIKPMFSLVSTNVSSAVTSSGNSFGDLNFSSSVQANNVGKPLFGAVTSTSAATTTTTTASKTFTTTTSYTTNIFGSFGSNAIVSSSTNSSTNNPIASTPQFGTFNKTSTTTGNMFGSFSDTQKAAKPENMFGSTTTNTGFSFGASTTTAASALGTSMSATTSISIAKTGATPTTSGGAWSNSFALNTKEIHKPSMFTFGLSNNDKASTASIFGTATSNTETKVPAFGSVNTNASAVNSPISIFASNPAPPSTNIFGTAPSGSAATPTPAFGTSPFGGAASSTNTTPTFGSTAAASSNTAFGGFGAVTAPIANTALEAKKPPFAFGAPSAQNSSGSFSFGSAATNTVKPAFNFGATPTQQPAFNFTGTSESSQNSTKPFQFGATPTAPVFNFTGGTIETASNTPFQFNAGSTPTSSNIFAPTPTSGAQSAQQARRKIRPPVRRMTPR
uniref:Nuclear pore complex protein Nup153 n=1 Tax=Glossina brevipalpis TaxID=37001 RepID=A0A1A9WB00_9MUSC